MSDAHNFHKPHWFEEGKSSCVQLLKVLPTYFSCPDYKGGDGNNWQQVPSPIRIMYCTPLCHSELQTGNYSGNN